MSIIPKQSEKMLASIIKWNPWTWITLLYASQVLGAMLVTVALGLSPSDLGLPLSLLAAGAIHALLVSYRNPPANSGVKHHWIPAIIYSAFIFSLSNESFADTQVSVDVNIFHPIEYAVLAVLFCWMWHTMLLSGRVWPLIARVLFGGMIFALLDEFHQSFIAGRDASVMDLVLDFIGLCIGCAVLLTGRYILTSGRK